MDARLFLAIAENLLREVRENPDPARDGAKSRTASSRAYYAAFHVARELYDALGLRLPNGSLCHSVAKDGLNNSSIPSLIKISEQLGTLYTARADADYELRKTQPEDPSQVALHISMARTAILMIDMIRNGRANPPLDFRAISAIILAWATQAGKPLSLKPNR